MRYFEIFSLTPRLSIDLADLERRFYARSRELHPDRFVRAPKDAQQKALDESSVLNDAYRTLKDPTDRAEYVLKQLGIDSKALPEGFLEEVFELNMEVEEGGDRTILHDKLKAIDETLNGLYLAWQGGESEPVLTQIRETLNQRRYIENLVNPHV